MWPLGVDAGSVSGRTDRVYMEGPSGQSAVEPVLGQLTTSGTDQQQATSSGRAKP